MSTHDYQDTAQVYETDPIVSVDLSVGAKLHPGQVLEVDYDLLRDTLAQAGAPEDNRNLHLRIDSKQSIPGSNYGIFRPEFHDDGSLKDYSVRVACNKPTRTQDTLEHEFTHYAEYVRGDSHMTPTKRNNAQLRVVNVGMKSVIPAAGLSVTAEAYDAVQTLVHESLYIHETLYTIPVSLGALAMAGVYFASKAERHARKAARQLKLDPTIFIR